MCDADFPNGFRSGSWPKARREHRCYACRETIRPGDLYHREAGTDDGEFFCHVHCARCWRMLEFLCQQSESTVRYDLDCGEPYDAPEDDPGHALAFMTPDEAQTWARKEGRRDG